MKCLCHYFWIPLTTSSFLEGRCGCERSEREHTRTPPPPPSPPPSLLTPTPTPVDDARHLQRCYDFIDYTHNEDADGEEFTDFIPDAFAELGYIYWYKMQDADRALKCYHREMKLRVPMLRRTNCYVFNVLLGPCPERMADIHVRRDKKKAIRLYQQACDECVDEELKIYGVTMGRCLSKLAQLQAEHRTDNFRKAFQYLFDCAGKHYTIHRETIAKCYLCLAKCQEPVRKAIEYAEQALFLFVIDPLSLEHNVDQCCDLIIDLHRKVRSPSMVVPKKDHLLQRRKVQEINDEHIERMLQNTLTGLSKRTTK